MHVGGVRVKPSRDVKLGETLEITQGTVRRLVEVTGLADRRGSAAVAATLYTETPESVVAREEEGCSGGCPRRSSAGGRRRSTAAGSRRSLRAAAP